MNFFRYPDTLVFVICMGLSGVELPLTYSRMSLLSTSFTLSILSNNIVNGVFSHFINLTRLCKQSKFNFLLIGRPLFFRTAYRLLTAVIHCSQSTNVATRFLHHEHF